jgi:hypothetical protein
MWVLLPCIETSVRACCTLKMVSIVNHKNLQAVQKLSFCYSCGGVFVPTDEIDRDHVPPRSCFALGDRTRPLILPTHKDCNGSYKVSDERVGQFISLRHGRVPSPKNDRLQFRFFRDPRTGETSGAVANVEIREAIERWVRAFHAALYQEPLDPNTRFGIETPFAVAVPTPKGIIRDTGRPQHRVFVSTIKENRAANNVDYLSANNGKLRYECVWVLTTQKVWVAVFALDIYDWKDLGRLSSGLAKGCVGFYQTPTGVPPKLACRQVTLDTVIPNEDSLDPFGT